MNFVQRMSLYLEKAFKAGAQRVELCDNLAVGGTTPSYGVIKAAVELAKDYQAKVIVMIRPRGGDFVYSQQELAIMLEDIKCARDLGVDGFALGCFDFGKPTRYRSSKDLAGCQSRLRGHHAYGL